MDTQKGRKKRKTIEKHQRILTQIYFQLKLIKNQQINLSH
ncbi:conserved protein of unknown function [Pseudomonas marincola]|uniref:Uncharacterized protein n=1 Tax=Pseudomonas marincola TaxID=437900 RepID=A0A653E0K5_9PSED|nr:conserved protein of unknown function [Pseudomonas marincola]